MAAVGKCRGEDGFFCGTSLNYAFSGGELPGTINISPLTMGLVVTDICQSLARQGFRNILLVLGHGGTENIIVLKESLKLFLRRNPHLKNLNLALVRGGKYSPLSKKAGKEGDFHAGYNETSRMLHWAPELVREKIVLDSREVVEHMMKDQDNYLEITKNVDEEELIPFMRQRPDIKVGVMGNPSKASRELGRKICEQMVDGVAGLVERIEAASKEKK